MASFVCTLFLQPRQTSVLHYFSSYYSLFFGCAELTTRELMKQKCLFSDAQKMCKWMNHYFEVIWVLIGVSRSMPNRKCNIEGFIFFNLSCLCKSTKTKQSDSIHLLITCGCQAQRCVLRLNWWNFTVHLSIFFFCSISFLRIYYYSHLGLQSPYSGKSYKPCNTHSAELTWRTLLITIPRSFNNISLLTGPMFCG